MKIIWYGYKNKAVYLFVLVILLVVTGCSSGGNDNYHSYYAGNQGVEISFLPQSPRETYNQGEFLNVQLEVSNQGRYSYPEGAIFLDGFDKQAIFFSSLRKNIQPLEGKSQKNPEGGISYVQFEENLPVKVPYGDLYKTKLQATSCFRYQTLATVNACIIPEISDIAKDKVTCKAGITSLSNQAAPVAVTRVEERIARDIVQFINTIENVGNGRIINPVKLDLCPYQLEPKDIDLVGVDLTIDTLGSAECANDNVVQLFNGKGVIVCKFITRPDLSSYETPLTITLDYGYSKTIKTELQIYNPEFTGLESNDY